MFLILSAFAGIVYGQILNNDALITINWVCAVFQAVFVMTIILVSQPKVRRTNCQTQHTIFLRRGRKTDLMKLLHEQGVLSTSLIIQL